jgi:hypothetical protein
MTAPVFAGLQKILNSPTGAGLLARDAGLRSFAPVLSMHPDAPSLQALGPLAASLPTNFAQRAADPAATADLGRTIAQAYAAARTPALAEIDARSLAAAQAVAAAPAEFAVLSKTARQLKPYSIYGAAASERLALFAEQAAAARTQAAAGRLARRLLEESRAPESDTDVHAGDADPSRSASPYFRLAPFDHAVHARAPAAVAAGTNPFGRFSLSALRPDFHRSDRLAPLKNFGRAMESIFSKTLEVILTPPLVILSTFDMESAASFLAAKLPSFDPEEIYDLVYNPFGDLDLVWNHLRKFDLLRAYESFWGTWNPMCRLPVKAVYVSLGGKRRPVIATTGAFLFSGAVMHGLVLAAPWYIYDSFTKPGFGLSSMLSTIQYVTIAYLLLGAPVVLSKILRSAALRKAGSKGR